MAPRRIDRPAYRIATERLVLRCWQPADAPVRKSVIDANLAALAPWLHWLVDHPMPLEGHVAALRRCRANFDLGECFSYALFDPAERELLGGASLRPQEDETCGIGYWLAAEVRGRGLATEAAAALIRVAFEAYRIQVAELVCIAANDRSGALARRLGFTLEGTLRRRPPRGGHTGSVDVQLWALLADEYPASPSSSVPASAWDAAGEPLGIGAPPP